MFLAIVNDTYSEVKSSNLKDKSHLWLYVAKGFRKIRCCKGKETIEEKEDQITQKLEGSKSMERRVNKQFQNKQVMQDLFKVVEQKDSAEFQKLAKRVAFVEGSMEKLHERFDLLIVKMKKRVKKYDRTLK